MRLSRLKAPLILTLLLVRAGSAAAQQTAGPTVTDAAQQLSGEEARYRAAIALQPSVAAYHHSLGIVLERQGRIQDAVRAYAEAVRLDSIQARHQAAYGRLLLLSGDRVRGMEHLRAAVTRNSEDVPSRVLLAETLIAQRDFAEAAPLLQDAQRLRPEDTQIAALLKQADAQAPQVGDGYHDLSDFEDEAAPNVVLIGTEILFGTLLVVAGAILLLPILSTLFLLLVQAPIAWARGTLS